VYGYGYDNMYFAHLTVLLVIVKVWTSRRADSHCQHDVTIWKYDGV
jgi:hypothetical protein